MSPEVKSASLRNDAVDEVFNATEVNTEIPSLRGMETLPESRNVACVQSHNANTGDPTAPGTTQVRLSKPKSENLNGSRKSDWQILLGDGRADHMGKGPAKVNALKGNIYR